MAKRHSIERASMRPPANECAERTVGARKRYNIVNALKNATRERAKRHKGSELGHSMTVSALESRRLSVGTIQRANRLSVHQRRLEVSHLILAHDLLVEVAEAGRLGYPSAQHVSSLVDQCFEPDRDTSGPGRWPVIPLAQLNPHTLLRRPRHLFRLGRTIDGPLDVQPGRRAAFNAHADCPRRR